jgi:multidrug efflux pump subunit AcrA (membrane-fusion protein)
MKAKFSLFVPLVALALASCNSKPAGDGSTENGTVSMSLFKEGKGVWFSDVTKTLFGLEIAEVAEKPIQRQLETTAQVYRGAHEGSPASALILLSDDEAKELKIGQPVGLKAATGKGLEATGELVQLDTQAHAALGQVEGLVEFADSQQHFPVGAFVAATLTKGEARPAFVVPESAVLVAADGSYVYTVNGTHLTRTRIKAGVSSAGFVEIEDGLYAGDWVAVKGVENLWLVELSALKGGTPCCPAPKKNAEK